jgi:uncharacterized protein CbrC (UPF0167 family)
VGEGVVFYGSSCARRSFLQEGSTEVAVFRGGDAGWYFDGLRCSILPDNDDMLPQFTYHPDPVATGSIKLSGTVCICCEKARGYIYTGPVYAGEELDEQICPWCIADGSAAERFGAEFTDAAGVASGLWPAVPDSVVEEVSRRTPGFSG